MADFQYAKLFNEAFGSFMAKYKDSKFRFLDENAMRSAIFFECLDLMHANEMPAKIEPNAHAVSNNGMKADLVLGDREVVVEFKFEPRFPRLFGWTSKVPVVLWEEVKKDLAKIELYKSSGVPVSHFIMIDEDGRWAKSREMEGGWKKISLSDRDIFVAHIVRR